MPEQTVDPDPTLCCAASDLTGSILSATHSAIFQLYGWVLKWNFLKFWDKYGNLGVEYDGLVLYLPFNII